MIKKLLAGLAAATLAFVMVGGARADASPTYTMSPYSAQNVGINYSCEQQYNSTADRTQKACVSLYYYTSYGVPSNTSSVSLVGTASLTCYNGNSTASANRITCQGAKMSLRSYWLSRTSVDNDWTCGAAYGASACTNDGKIFNGNFVFLDAQQTMPETRAYCSDPTHAAILNIKGRSNGWDWYPANTDSDPLRTPDINLCYPGAPSA